MSSEKYAYNFCKNCRQMYKYHIDERCPFDSTEYEWNGVDMKAIFASTKELAKEYPDAAYIHYTQPIEATISVLEYHEPKKEEDSDKDPD